MFLDFFGLHEQPFGVTPDPAYLYPSQTHCEALDALTEGILDGRGFLALIAEPGMGKTTLLYQVLEGLRNKARAVFLFQTQCTSREFFQYLLSELGVDSTGMGLVPMHNKLNEILFAEMLAGRRFVLIVDEAQNLDDKVLETIRLLSNYETSHTKLLQIVLAGQPQLGEKLKQKHLAQLLQRIAVLEHLSPLSAGETAGYIRYRLKVAGYNGEELFDPNALALIAEQSQGVPRNINRICFHALMQAHAEGCRAVSVEIVEKANRKLDLSTVGSTPTSSPPATDSESAAVAPATQQLMQKEITVFSTRPWHRRAGPLVAILLSAGLALPYAVSRQMMQRLRGWVTAPLPSMVGHSSRSVAYGGGEAQFSGFSKGLVQSEDADYRLQTKGIGGSADGNQVVEPRISDRGIAHVTAIQISSTEDNARIVVRLDDTIQFNAARISSPKRIYFDLYKARLDPSVEQKTVPLGNGLVKWVRAAQNTDDFVRLVLDAEGAKVYSVRLVSDPYRLLIDVYAQPLDPTKKGVSPDAGQHNGGKAYSEAIVSQESRPTLTRELGLKIKRIVIDPGHGGYDTGATGPHGLAEKNLCLDVALKVGQLIERNIAGAEVIYTRKDDRYVPLEKRTAIANNALADLFISIHANSNDSKEVRGVETYYLSLATSPDSEKVAMRENVLGQSSIHDLPNLIQKITRDAKLTESKQLALDIQISLSERLDLKSRRETNRGVKQAPFIVLTGANMPAVLSEISYLSNMGDESLLLDSGRREQVAEGLYLGIATYLDSLKSLVNNGQKLVSENRLSTLSGLATSSAAR